MLKKNICGFLSVFLMVNQISGLVWSAPQPLGEDLMRELLFEEFLAITASAKEEPLDEAPAHIYVITGHEMMARGYRTLTDLFKDLPSSSVIQYAGDSGDFPSPSGLTLHRGTLGGLKLMINGMEIDPKHGINIRFEERFPIEGIERVEFILGPYASLYGRSSYSGVLNVILKTGEAIEGGNVYALAGDDGQLQSTFLFGEKYGPWDFYLSLFKNYSKDGLDLAEDYPGIYGIERRRQGVFDGAPVAFGSEVSTDYIVPWDNHEVYYRMSHDKGLDLDIQWNRVKGANINGRYNPLGYVASHDAHHQAPVFNAKLKYVFDTDRMHSETSVAYQSWYLKAQNVYIADPAALVKHMYSKARAFDFNQSLRYSLSEKNEIYLSVAHETTREWTMNTSFSGWPKLPVFFTTRYLNVSVQDEIKLTDTVKTVAGVMYENSNKFDDVFLPRLSFMWNPNQKTALKLLYGHGYVVPDKSLTVDQPTSTGVVKGADDLDPTSIVSYDVQLIYKVSDRLKTSASVFYTIQEDFTGAVSDPTMPAPYNSYYTNIDGDKEAFGGEWEVEAIVTDAIRGFFYYAHVDGHARTVDGSGNPTSQDGVVFAPRHQLKVGIHFLLWQKKMNLYLHDLYTGSSGNWTGEAKSRTGGYNHFDVNIKTTEKWHSRFSLSAGIRNVFNKEGFYTKPLFDPYFIDVPVRKRYWTIQAGYKF